MITSPALQKIISVLLSPRFCAESRISLRKYWIPRIKRGMIAFLQQLTNITQKKRRLGYLINLIATHLFLQFMLLPSTFATPVSLELHDVDLAAALHLLAATLHHDVILSSTITGTVSLTLHQQSAENVFELLLTSHHLIKINKNHSWIILPQTEFLQQKQDTQKLQLLIEQITPLTTHIWQLHYANATDIAKILQDKNNALLSPQGSLHIDARTNQLIIQDNKNKLAIINQIIKKTDIPIKQIMIETRLASVDQDFIRELGIRFSTRAPTSIVTSLRKKNYSSEKTSLATGYALAVAHLADGSLLDIQLAAAETKGHAELISSPKLFTSSQQAASIEAGEEIPYQEISASGATGVAFRKAVLSLHVTPQILPGRKVLLTITLHEDKPASRIVQGVPAISTRQLRSQILALDGQTIILGGIFETSQRETRPGIPFLRDIPLIGHLFEQQNIEKNRRELVIFVTPHIIG